MPTIRNTQFKNKARKRNLSPQTFAKAVLTHPEKFDRATQQQAARTLKEVRVLPLPSTSSSPS